MTSGTHDGLDQQVSATLAGSWKALFLTELFQGAGLLALFLLLLEAVSEWGEVFSKPDVYVLLVVALGQSAVLAWRSFKGLAQPWWSRLVGLGFYAAVEAPIEGYSFFVAPHHIAFAVLMLVYAWGTALEARASTPSASGVTGVILSRAAQGLGPVLFYIALEIGTAPWAQGVSDFFSSTSHAFLLALAVTQTGALIALALVARGQQTVIGDLLHQLKMLSRWGFGSRVAQEVLRESGTRAAVRVERAIGFIDVRGFTAWSEARPPEEVIAMLNHFYGAVLTTCAGELIKSKMSGDEVLVVLSANNAARHTLQRALAAAMAAVEPLHLSAGAGLWIGPVVEGFFGAQTAPIHDVIGDTVNTAKRLCDHAQGGQLLAGPLSSLSDTEADQVSISAKGKTQPVTAARYRASPNP